MMLSDQLTKRYRKGNFHLKRYITDLNMKPGILACALLSICIKVKAGWFEVENYEGKIDGFTVHVSLQMYSTMSGSESIMGSYYYDKYRTPIPLHGKIKEENIILCEIKNKKNFDSFLMEGGKPEFTYCEFSLKKMKIS